MEWVCERTLWIGMILPMVVRTIFRLVAAAVEAEWEGRTEWRTILKHAPSFVVTEKHSLSLAMELIIAPVRVVLKNLSGTGWSFARESLVLTSLTLNLWLPSPGCTPVPCFWKG